MNESLNYAQILRTIGQALEALDIQSFVLRKEAGDLTVSLQDSRVRRRLRRKKFLRVSWRRLRGKELGPRLTHKPSSGVVELHYTDADIARVDSEGRAKRGTTAGTPEPHSLSQILRAVGGFVDQQRGQLLTVRRENQNVNFEYESRLKTKVCQQFTVPRLYDYWVKMYLHRRDRPGAQN